MDGDIIARLGVRTYMDNVKYRGGSNIDFFASEEELRKMLDECNGACHHPGYRVLYRPAQYKDVIDVFESINPAVAGVVDGVYTTAKQIKMGGVRSAEGIGIAGGDKILTVGIENQLMFDLVKDLLTKSINADIGMVENPITQVVIKLVSTYFSMIPVEVFELAIRQGKLKFEDPSVLGLVNKAVNCGLIPPITEADAAAALSMLGSSGMQKFIGKQVGKKIATHVATVIALTIAAKLARSIAQTRLYRSFSKLKATGAKSPNGLAGLLISLLKAQGILGIAAKGSRTLKSKCPKTWSYMRYNLNGIDMLFFIVEDSFTEMVDRISLFESDPVKFGEIMGLLVEAGKLGNICFPDMYDKA